MESVDEIIIKFNQNNLNLNDFIKDKKPNQRIIVDVTKLPNESLIDFLPIFISAATAHKNFALRLGIDQRDFAPELYESNISYFFDEFIDTWDKLVSIIKLQVSDVYIVSDLGFNLKDVSLYCKKNNVKIRVFPNVSQFSAVVGNLDKIKGFFIRPDDISDYEEFVDVCEFFGDLDKQSVLYEIYTKENWSGKLNQLILNLDNNSNISNKTIAPIFGTMRVNCNKKCYRGQCNKCDRLLSTAQILEENNLIIEKE
jgi:hypothetical protein